MACKEYWNNCTTLWVTSKDMKYDRISDSLMKISDSALEDMQLYSPGTLLMVTRSGILKRTLPLAILDRYATVNQDIKTISVLNPCLPEYVFYAIRSNELKILKEYHKDGTTVDSINFDKFISLDLPLPPLGEQKRIINEVEKWMRAVESIESSHFVLNETILTTKSRILSLAISGKLVPQDPTDEPAIDLLKRINPDFVPCDNSHYPFDIPNGWQLCTIGDLFRHNTGKALNSSNRGGVPLRYITTSNLYWDKFDLSETRQMLFTDSEIEKCQVQKGDLLVCEGGDIGRAAIWMNDAPIMIQNHIHKLRPKTDICTRFYLYIFMLYKSRGMIGGKGIGILGLSARELDRMAIPVPPIEEQQRITYKIDTMFSFLSELNALAE